MENYDEKIEQVASHIMEELHCACIETSIDKIWCTMTVDGVTQIYALSPYELWQNMNSYLNGILKVKSIIRKAL